LSLASLSLAWASPQHATAQPEPDKELNCSDGKDNDGDGVIDCEDADCADNPACQSPPPSAKPDRETNCTDRIDNDGDSVVDCADSDCYDDPACKPNGMPENTNSLCSDFIDNDGDGAIDCDDMDCQGPGVTACKGSWRGPNSGTAQAPMDMPALGPGMSVEDLIGTGSDKDGERNDILCSDGIDNDGDGRIDCADFGCRFDPSVTVCTGNPDIRFSVVGQLSHSHYFKKDPSSTLPEDDTRVTALQLRALGPIRGIENSFFLLSMRAERTPRLTFAMFQIPVGSRFYLNVNSGGGSLSTGLIKSASKRPLIDPAYYLYSSFEQGNGAAVDFGGPINASGSLQFRTYVAGGSGRYNGNVGGRYFRDEDVGNYTYSFGAQATVNLIGYFHRFDTGFLYTKVPTMAAFSLGAKYDQRSIERYPAGNAQLAFRSGIFSLESEFYGKRELEFKSTQFAYNVTGGLLLVPKHLFFAADYGAFIAGKLEKPPEDLFDTGSDVRKQRDEMQARAALHWFFYRHVGVLSALYRYRDVKSSRDQKDGYKESEGRLVASYWF
jgi:hypothetical protein